MTVARRAGLLLAMVALLVGAASTAGRSNTPAHAQGSASVAIQNFAFTPAQLSVAGGAIVRWTNMDGAPHTVTSGAPDGANIGTQFRSTALSTGGTFAFTFSEPGIFSYFCEIHPRMRGTVTVTSASEPPATQPQPQPQPQPAPPAPAPVDTPTAAIIARDFSFSAPLALPQGVNRLTLTNQGQEPHHAQIMRLNDGVSLEQFGAAAQQGPGAIFPLVSFRGGPGTVDPGGMQDVWVDLPAGAYLYLCFVSSPDGVSHAAKGMVQPFQVTDEANPATPPADVPEAELGEFYLVLPEMQAGVQTIKLSNAGDQPHELALIKLAPGAGLDDVIAFFTVPAGPPPFSSAGGFQAVDSGLSGWVQLNLSSGNYLAICNVPDPESGKPHYELGMVTGFEIP